MKTNRICTACYDNNRRPQRNDEPESKPIQPIFHPTLTAHSHLSVENRASIVAFHRINIPKKNIMQYIALDQLLQQALQFGR